MHLCILNHFWMGIKINLLFEIFFLHIHILFFFLLFLLFGRVSYIHLDHVNIPQRRGIHIVETFIRCAWSNTKTIRTEHLHIISN